MIVKKSHPYKCLLPFAACLILQRPYASVRGSEYTLTNSSGFLCETVLVY